MINYFPYRFTSQHHQLLSYWFTNQHYQLLSKSAPEHAEILEALLRHIQFKDFLIMSDFCFILLWLLNKI